MGESTIGEQHARDRLAQLLLRKGVITEEQLDDAIRLAEAGVDEWVVKCLEELEYVTERDVAVAFAELTGYEFLDLTEEMIDSDAADLIPRELADDLSAIGVRFDGERLVIAIATPSRESEQRLREATGREVKLVNGAFSVIYGIRKKRHPRQPTPEVCSTTGPMFPTNRPSEDDLRKMMNFVRESHRYEAKKRELKLGRLSKEEVDRILAERSRLWNIYTASPLPEDPGDPVERARLFQEWCAKRAQAHAQWFDLSKKWGLLNAFPPFSTDLDQIRSLDEAIQRAPEPPRVAARQKRHAEPSCDERGCDQRATARQEIETWPWEGLKDSGAPVGCMAVRMVCEAHALPERWESPTARLRGSWPLPASAAQVLDTDSASDQSHEL